MPATAWWLLLLFIFFSFGVPFGEHHYHGGGKQQEPKEKLNYLQVKLMKVPSAPTHCPEEATRPGPRPGGQGYIPFRGEGGRHKAGSNNNRCAILRGSGVR